MSSHGRGMNLNCVTFCNLFLEIRPLTYFSLDIYMIVSDWFVAQWLNLSFSPVLSCALPSDNYTINNVCCW